MSFQVAFCDDEGRTAHALVAPAALEDFLDFYRERVIDIRPVPND